MLSPQFLREQPRTEQLPPVPAVHARQSDGRDGRGQPRRVTSESENVAGRSAKLTGIRERDTRNRRDTHSRRVLPALGVDAGCSRPSASGPASSARRALSANAMATSDGHGEGVQRLFHPFSSCRRTPILVLSPFLQVPLTDVLAASVRGAGPPRASSTPACFPGVLVAGASRST